jgi:hypothetical protein
MVFCMSMLLFLLLHLRHYPVTVSLLSLFLLRIIVDARVERVIVSEDRFIIVTRHLLPFLNKKRVVLFSAIESIHIPPGNSEMFLLRYKDGDHWQVAPSIQRAQFHKAVGVIETSIVK